MRFVRYGCATESTKQESIFPVDYEENRQKAPTLVGG